MYDGWSTIGRRLAAGRGLEAERGSDGGDDPLDGVGSEDGAGPEAHGGLEADEIRRVVQAARALLRRDAADFAAEVGVGTVAIRRIEAGVAVRRSTADKVLAGLARIGVSVLKGDDGCAGIVLGVGLTARARVSPPPLASAHTRPGSRQKAPARPPKPKTVEP